MPGGSQVGRGLSRSHHTGGSAFTGHGWVWQSKKARIVDMKVYDPQELRNAANVDPKCFVML